MTHAIAWSSPAAEVRLTPHEILLAGIVALLRRIEDLGKGDKCGRDLTDPNSIGWSMEIEGACGELAVAKFTGRTWLGVGVMRGDDVPGLQVRTTRHTTGRLLVRRDDPNEATFVLVTGRTPVFVIRGWVYGREAKRDEWWGAPNPTAPALFCVPQAALHSPVDLVGG